MRIYDVIAKTIVFKGVREDKNAIEQLKKENSYSLSENNQGKISKAIENLGNNSDEKSIEFLLDVADNLKYGTNIVTDAEPKNDWKTKLKNAASNSLEMSNPVLKEKYEPKIKRLFVSQKPLSPEEQEILQLKGRILEQIDKSQLKDEKNSNIKNIERNINNFIVSSEVSLNQKKYILNRFEYLLSSEYKINPQLENKKTVILAEMLNDLVVNTGGKIPNTKAINQKNHGMCAAIAIARKLMSYEYKTDYVDSILSELDNNDTMQVYDLAHSGEGKKIPVKKTFVDFEDALNKGYRIVDASTSQWMNIADMFGIDNKTEMAYTAFDRAHFGTFSDGHYKKPFGDDNLDSKQSYYQSLIVTKKSINDVKIHKLEKKDNYRNRNNRLDSDLRMISDLNSSLGSKVKKIIPSLSQSEIRKVVNELLSLETKYSYKIDKFKDETKKYHYLPNEEDIMKKKKIKSFITDNFKNKVDSKILDESLKDIHELTEMSNSISEKTNINENLARQIKHDRNLYNAAAAYRTSMIMALYDDDLKTDSMIHYNIVDVENYLSDVFSKYMERVKNGDRIYIDHFASGFGTKADKKSVLELLTGIKGGVDFTITNKFDELYAQLGVSDKKNALLGKIKSVKNSIESGDKDNLRIMSVTMGVKKDKNKILDKLNEYERILSGNSTEKQYREILNKMGTKNQMEEIAEAFEVLAEAIKNPDDEFNDRILRNCKLANGLDEDASSEELQPVMMNFANEFNEIAQNIEIIRKSLEIYDNDGDLIDCGNPTFLIIKKMENESKIIPSKELKVLQKRYDAIDKIRSEDEFSSRQGKISDPTLYKYTNGEKETLKKIKKLTNTMASDVNKELAGIYREIKPDLEEHTRKIGVSMGLYWAPSEGTSGLYKFQQGKILQQLTDKPYKGIENLEKAVDIIKNGPHSGISGTSVFHDKVGMHAQYIAEIEEKDGKDILFHDNTWGASEHENVWTDSENTTRTDYSDKRGGELGYITDSKWRNGNYVKNLTEKTGDYKPEQIVSRQIRKLKNETNEDYKFPLMTEILVPGINPEADSIVASIKDNIFLPDSNFIEQLEKKAANMTVAEVKGARTKNETAGKLYKKELDIINKRIKDTPFNKGIKSKADFDALDDNDNLKVLFEKAAVEMSYKYIPMWKELAKVNSVKEVNNLKEKQRMSAKENFDYAFAKKPEILYAYALNKTKNHIFDILETAFKNNNMTLTDEEKYNVIKNTAVYEKNELNQFDGSLKNTIDFMVNKMLKQFDTVVKDSENARKTKEEIRKNLKKDLEKALYFAPKDIKKDTELHEAIKKYIDKKYNPQTNEEFVEIYKKLQDMTTKEFELETKDAQDADMAFKNYTGYDMLVKYKASNSVITDEIRNLVWQKHVVNDIDFSDVKTSFQYKKLQKKVRGAIYEKDRTYDDLYKSFNYSLQSLNYEKMFNEFKDEGYRKYGVMPGYPKIEIFDDNLINEKINLLNKCIIDTANSIHSKKINLYVYELTDKVNELLAKVPDDKKLTKKQTALLNGYVGDFVTTNYGDQNIARSVKAASEMLEISSSKATAGEYKKYFSIWKSEINAVKKMNSEEVILDDIKDDLHILKENIYLAVTIDIPKKYQSKVRQDINNFINEEVKDHKTPFDDNLKVKKLKNKLFSNSVSGINEEKIDNLFNNMSLSLQQIKKLRIASIDNKTNQSIQHDKVINAVMAAVNLFITEDDIDKFSENVANICIDERVLKRADVNKMLLDEILKYSDADKNKILASKEFKSLSYNILTFNSMIRTGNKYQSNLKLNSEELQNTINNFIEKNVKPESKEIIGVNMQEYLKSILTESKKIAFDEEKLYNLREKLVTDYKEYNYLNHPQEILNRYVELCAKDGEISKAKTNIERLKLTQEKDMVKNNLALALGLASIVEMQEILMNAAELGNPAVAFTKFKNYDSDWVDNLTGARATLADPKIIDYMVRSLILENDYDTAVMFVEKMGLTDKFLEIEDGMIDVKKAKLKVDKITNILKTTNKQTEIFMDELVKLNNCIESEDFVAKIDKTKQSIIKRAKNLSREKTIKNYLEALDNVKVLIDANPDLPKSLVLNQTTKEVMSEITNQTKEDIEKIQDELKQIRTVCNMISKLNVPEYRDGYKFKQSIGEKYDEINDYNDDSLRKVISESKSISISKIEV